MRARRAAFDQIARQRERRPCEPEQRNVELLAKETDSLQDVRNVQVRIERSQPSDVGFGADRLVHDRTAAGLDADGDANRRKGHHDVAEQDRGVHGHAAKRLQRDLGHELGMPAGLEDVAVASDPAVLGQITAGLPHEPHRRAIHRPPPARTQEAIGGNGRAHTFRIRTSVLSEYS